MSKAVVVHCLDDARAAMTAAAELEAPVTLLSAEGAAGFVGALWFRELVLQASVERPEVAVTAIIDCSDKPGLVLAALRQGLKTIRFTGRRSTAATLAALAAEYQAEVVTGRLKSLDLHGQRDPLAACRAWLAQR